MSTSETERLRKEAARDHKRIAELEADLAEAVIERDMNYKTMVLYMEKKEQAEHALAQTRMEMPA